MTDNLRWFPWSRKRFFEGFFLWNHRFSVCTLCIRENRQSLAFSFSFLPAAHQCVATVLPSRLFFIPPIWLVVVAWWLACQAWQPFSPFGSYNSSSFEDETPVLVAFSEEPFMGWGGFSLSASARLSPVTLKHKHKHAHPPTHSHATTTPWRGGGCRAFLSQWLAVAPAARARMGPLAGPAL